MVNIEGICSLSAPKRFVFALIASVLAMVVSALFVALGRPLVLPLGIAAQFGAALSPLVLGAWFFSRSLRATRQGDVSVLQMLKETFFFH